MSKIYDQHRAAFAQVSAYVVLKDGERVATIAFKFPRDGAGRLYAYVHWIGVEMVRGHANGYGYDKRSAACESAAAKAWKTWGLNRYDLDRPNRDNFYAFFDAISAVGGSTWDRRLQDAGFTVLQAV